MLNPKERPYHAYPTIDNRFDAKLLQDQLSPSSFNHRIAQESVATRCSNVAFGKRSPRDLIYRELVER